jgi:thioredoxin 2
MTTPSGAHDAGASGQSGRPPQPATGPVSILTCANCGTRNAIRPSERGAPHCGKCGKPLPWIVDATDATFDLEARTQLPVLVDLWAPWCGPCRFVTPIVEELAKDYAGRLKIVKVNVDDNPGIAQRYQVQGIPTLLILRNGQPAERIVGALPKEELTARVMPHVLGVAA